MLLPLFNRWNTDRYYYEKAHHQDLELLDVIFDAFPEELKESMLCAHFHNTAGNTHFGLNQLDKCRENFKITYSIRKTNLDPDDVESEEEFGNIIHNMAMLECAAGNYDKALELLLKAKELREKLPIPEEQRKLHNLNTNLGRIYLFQNRILEAEEQYVIAERIIHEKFDSKTIVHGQ